MDNYLIGIISSISATILNWVAIKTYEAITGVRRNYFWKRKHLPLTKMTPHYDFDSLRKRLRLLVIDDEDVFPITLFQEAGYNIERWEKVKNYRSLENGDYDIIILDILNVAEDLSEEDGFGVLESIKKHNPAQIVIAYSAHSFDFSKQRFWELADAKISKPSMFLKIKEIVDNTITECFTLERYVDVLHKLLRDFKLNEKSIAKVDAEIIKGMKKKREPDWKKIMNIVDDRNLYNVTKSISLTITNNFPVNG
ncbi:hypothetical protein [Roseimarinus sediminis]|uniref:hypothetical protein n=1 Tax=Roseimarinus sediminis TaxID=1610899 RepID=UPI003D258461